MTAAGGSPGEKPQNRDEGPPPGGYEPPPIEQVPAYGGSPPPMPGYPSPLHPEFPETPGFPPGFPPGAPPGYGGYPPPPPPGYTGYPPEYGVPYPGAFGYPAVPPPTSKLAITSLVVSLLGLICGVGIVFALVGIVFGAVAINQIKRSGERGYGQAVAGISIGVITLAFNLVWLIFAINTPI